MLAPLLSAANKDFPFLLLAALQCSTCTAVYLLLFVIVAPVINLLYLVFLYRRFFLVLQNANGLQDAYP